MGWPAHLPQNNLFNLCDLCLDSTLKPIISESVAFGAASEDADCAVWHWGDAFLAPCFQNSHQLTFLGDKQWKKKRHTMQKVKKLNLSGTFSLWQPLCIPYCWKQTVNKTLFVLLCHHLCSKAANWRHGSIICKLKAKCKSIRLTYKPCVPKVTNKTLFHYLKLPWNEMLPHLSNKKHNKIFTALYLKQLFSFYCSPDLRSCWLHGV